MAITNGYCSLDDIKAALRITDSVDNALLELAVESASRMVDSFTERTFYNGGTATRVYAPARTDLVQIDDCRTIGTVETSTNADYIYDQTWTALDYQGEPLNGLVAGQATPFTRIRATGDYAFPVYMGIATVRVTGVWGFATVPTAVKQATVIQAAREFKRFDSPLGVAGYGDMGMMRVSRYLDPDVEQLVRPWMRNTNAVA